MISWKHSFEKMSKDLELTKKKKETLDNLLNTGRISQSTYDSLNTELSKAIAEIETRQKELAGQMSSKIAELEEQVSTLEMLLASSEIQYVAGEIDDELHAHESKAFSLGLEATKQELISIRNIIASIMQEPNQPQLQLEAHEVTEAEIPKTEEVAGESLETAVEESVEEKTIEVTTETQLEKQETTEVATPKTEEIVAESLETTAEAPTETSEETVTEIVAETKIENSPETSETPIETPVVAPETPVEIPKQESAPADEEVTIEVIKEVKEEEIVSSEPIIESIEEKATAEVAGASPEDTTFFRDPKEKGEEKEPEKKEESEG